MGGLSGIRVERGEVELSCDKEDHGPHGGEARVAAGLALGGLEQTIEGFDETVCRVWVQATMPSKCLWIILATSFIGATRERMTLVHHCLSMAETTWICLRSRIARRCSR